MQQQQEFTYAPGFQFLRAGWDSGGQIGHIELNRPAASNAFNAGLWQDFPKVLMWDILTVVQWPSR